MNDELLSAAMRMLTRRPYFSGELKTALTRKYSDVTEEELIALIKRLTELHMIDDQKLIFEFVRFHMSAKPQGIFLMRRTLQQKGLDETLINEVLALYQDTEFEKAVALAASKSAILPCSLDLQKKKARLIRFLQGRGFSFSDALEASDIALRES